MRTDIKHQQLKFGIESPFLDDNKLFTVEELNEILANQQRYFIHYAEEIWLKQYHRMRYTAYSLQVPSITSSWSDVKAQITGITESKTERYIVKKVSAQEWLVMFEHAIQQLPEDFKTIIEWRYLKRRSDGQCYADDIVYDNLCLSRSTYYKLKPQALEELGRLLYQMTQEK